MWLVLPGAGGAAQDLQPSPPALSCLMSTRAVKSPLLTQPGPAAPTLRAQQGGFLSLRERPIPSSICADSTGHPELGLPRAGSTFPSFPSPKNHEFSLSSEHQRSLRPLALCWALDHLHPCMRPGKALAMAMVLKSMGFGGRRDGIKVIYTQHGTSEAVESLFQV